MPERLLCTVSDLSDKTAKICEVDGIEIGVIRHKGDIVAYKNVCPHQGGPVCEGLKMPQVCVELDDQQRTLRQTFNEDELHFVCPWHGWEFKIATGEAVGDPKYKMKRYNVVERGGEVYVEV
jgi:nitrite reductase/ring-hydroxylating ferredoxin subunit